MADIPVRQSTVAVTFLGFTVGALVMVSSEHKADSLIAKFKEAAERSERLMYEQSHRDYSALPFASSSACHGAVNHYRDNAITYKAQRTKMPENLKLANAAITGHAVMRQRDVAALDAKYIEGISR